MNGAKELQQRPFEAPAAYSQQRGSFIRPNPKLQERKINGAARRSWNCFDDIERPAQHTVRCAGIALQLSGNSRMLIEDMAVDSSSEDVLDADSVCDCSYHPEVAGLHLLTDYYAAYRIAQDNEEISVVAAVSLGMRRKRSIVLVKQHEK